MMADRRLLQRSGVLVALVVLLVVACGLICCAASWVVVVWVKDDMELYPRTLLDTEVAVDPGVLCAGSYEEFVQVASQLLSERGWEPSEKPPWVGGDMPCGSPSSLNNIDTYFTMVDFATGLPHLKMGYVGLDCSAGIAHVWIEDRGLDIEWQRPMDLSKVAVGLHEAVTIAEDLGGRTVREQMGTECDIRFWLVGYEWGMDYLNDAEFGVPVLTVRVNARSGRVNTED